MINLKSKKMITLKNIIIKAMRSVSYRKTATRLGGLLNFVRFVDTKSKCFNEKFKFAVDNKISTANWSYKNNTHHINISENCIEIANTQTVRSTKESIAFYKAVIRHEIGHALYTDRSSIVGQWCSDYNIPFGLFNLFEDVRIEYKIVKDYPQFKKFMWFKYMDIEDESETASNAILIMKSKEAGTRTDGGNSKTNPLTSFVPSLKNLKNHYHYFFNGKDRGSMTTKQILKRYYMRSCHAICSLEVVEITKDFVSTFGNEMPSQYEYENIINGEVDPNFSPQKNSSKNYTKANDDGGYSNCDYSDLPLAKSSFDNADVNYSKTIANRLKPIVKNYGRNRNKLSSSGSRLHIKNAIAKMENSFRSIKSKKGKPTITMLVDYSGSMMDTIMRNGGREFICAFKRLSDSNDIKLNLIFSMDRFGYLLNDHSVDDIMAIIPNGNHEALDNNLKRFFPLVKKSDLVLLFTDGYLTGNIVNESQYRNQGIELVACCIPSKNDVANVRKYCNGYFTKTFIDQSPTSLATRVVKYAQDKQKI